MRPATGHLSRLELDMFIVSSPESVDGALSEHVDSCARCAGRVEQLRDEDNRFIERFPSADALQRASKRPEPASADVTKPVSPWALRIGLGAAVAAAAAAAVVAIVITRPVPPPSRKTVPPAPTVRAKGGSIIEVAVSREGRSFIYTGQPLREGDILAFRYTTKKRYLLMLSLEKSGKINIFLKDPDGRRSMAISPGVRVRLSKGIELDDYPGPERLIAFLTDEPLEVAAVRRVIEKRYKSLSKRRKMSLDLGKLPFSGDEITWLIVKERR